MENITDSARETVQSVLARVDKSELSTGVRSKPFLGLPVKRIIPQDVHSLLDYAGGAAGMLAALSAKTIRGRMANTSLSAASTGVSAFTDYKLSLFKVIPIEVHEAIDYVWGIGNVVAPFALGYYRKDKTVSLLQIALGAGTIVASLFTDYRAFSRSRSNGSSGRTRSHSKRRTHKIASKKK
jgi:hypothetical protein